MQTKKCFLICGLLIATLLSAQSSLPPGAYIHELDNGLEVLLIENPALPMVGVNVVVKTGSAYETFSTSGMSHMLEHLLFNGTTSRTQKKLYDDVDRIGGYNNANTGEYYTNFMMVVPAEHSLKGMEIQADMLFNSTLPEDKFEKEKGIVLEEIAQSLARSSVQVEYSIKSILYRDHALSFPTLGTYSTIESLTRQEVWDYYRNTYVPNNMILSAIGKFNADSMLIQIKEIYGAARPGSIFRPSDSELITGFESTPELPLEPGIILHRFYSGDTPTLHLVYQLPQNPPTGFFDLLDESLTPSLKALEKTVKKHFTKDIKTLSHAFYLSPVANYLLIKTTLNSETNVESIVKFLTKRLSAIRFSLPDPTVQAEVTRTRTDFLKSLEKPHMFGIYNAEIFATSGIDAVFAALNSKAHFKAAIDLKHFRLDSNPGIIFHHSSKSRETESATATLTKLFTEHPSGLTLIAKQNRASQLLAVHILFKHKAFYNSKFGKDAAKILHDCFGQRMRSAQNQKISNRFGLTFTVNDNPYIPMDDIYLHADFGYIRVEGLAEDLPGAIAYLNRQMNQFVPNAEEYKQAVNKFAHGIDFRGTGKARKLFNEVYDSLLFEPEKYLAEAVELNYENLLAFAQDYFSPGNRIVSIVSPAAPDSISDLFYNSVIMAKENDRIEMAVYDKPFQSHTTPVRIEKDGGGQQSYLFWGFMKKIESSEKPALKALSLILSDKIVFDIREKQGMAYRMSAGVEVKENNALFYIRMGTRPQNVNVLLPQFPGYFESGTVVSVDALELEKRINMYLGRMMFRRLSSINQAYYLGHSLYFHNDIHYDQQFLEQLKKVTPDDVSQIAAKYLMVSNPLTIIIR